MNTNQDVRGANGRRIARMGVWIDLAEASPAADHVRFVFYWIAYEAGYQVNHEDSDSLRPSFHRCVARHDASGLQKLLIRHKPRITALLKLRQAHPSFWKQWDQDADVRTREDWEARFQTRVRADVRRLNVAARGGASPDVARTVLRSTRSFWVRWDDLNQAVAVQDEEALLSASEWAALVDTLFRNLGIVRNQIVHGGSAGSRSRGRTQVRLGAELLRDFVPHFRRTIERHPDQDWGPPPFPRVGDEADDKCLPPWLSIDAARRSVATEHG